MKLKGKRSELLSAFQRVQGVVEKRNTMPILSNVLLEANDNEIVIFATDLEIGIKARYPADVSEPGGVTVSARKIYEILRELPEGEVEITSGENHSVRIQSGGSDFKIVGLPPQEFPSMPPMEEEPLVPIDREVFSDLIRKTVFAAGDNDARYILNGLLISFIQKDNKAAIRFVGTDGHRLAVAVRSLENGKTGEKHKGPTEKTAIVPKKAAIEIKKLLDEGEEQPEIGINKNQLIFRLGGLLLMARLLEGNYPSFDQVIPKENKKLALAKKADLEGALRRVSILSREKNHAIKISLEKNSLTLTSSNPDIGEARETIPVKFSQEGLTAGFNARYLLDILGALDGDEVSLEFKDALSPCLVRRPGDQDYICVVMPMRV